MSDPARPARPFVVPRPRGAAFAAAVAVALAALVLVACGGADAPGGGAEAADEAADADGTADGPWSFTDDRGVVHELDHTPTRIAAQSVAAGGLYELGIVADGVFGPLRRGDGTPDPAIGLADPDEFTSLGEVDSQINMEALAALRPEIIVTAMWGEDEYWGIDDVQVDTVEKIAPIVGIRVDDRPVDEPIERFAELAESLGADPATIAGRKAEFEAAAEALRAANASNPDIRVVAASGTPAEMYVAYPPGFPDLNFYQSLGMDLVVPESHPTSGGFWETLSWEDAGKYPADLVLADARGGTVEQIREQIPASTLTLPAFEADQVASWPAVFAYGYGNMAANMEELATAVAGAKPVA